MRSPPRQVLFVASATAFSLLGDQFLYAVLPSYYDELGLLPIHVGILLSVNRWVRLLTNPLAERMYRRWPTGLVVATAFGLGSLLAVVYGAVSAFVVLLLARILWGLCWSFIRQAGIMTVVEGAVSGHVGRNMGFYNGISRLGSLVGMVGGGLAHDLVGWSAALFCFAAVSLPAAPLGYLSRRGTGRVSPPAASSASGRAHAGLVTTGFILGLVGSGMIIATLGYLLEARAGASIRLGDLTIGVATLTGLVLGVRWGSDLVAAPLFGAASDRLGRRRSAYISFAAGGLALLAAAPTSSVLALVAGVAVFLVATTALQVLLAAEAGTRGSGAVVVYVTATDMGAAAGPLVSWAALQLALPKAGILVAAGLFYLVGAVATRWTAPSELGGKTARRELGGRAAPSE